MNMNWKNMYFVMIAMLIMLVIAVVASMAWYHDSTRVIAKVEPYAEDAIATISKNGNNTIVRAYSLEEYDDRIEWTLHQEGSLVEQKNIYYIQDGIVTSNHFVWIFQDKHDAKYRYSWAEKIAFNVKINDNVLEGELREKKYGIMGKTKAEAIELIKENSSKFVEIKK